MRKHERQVLGTRLERFIWLGHIFDNRQMAERGKVLSRLSKIYPNQICQANCTSWSLNIVVHFHFQLCKRDARLRFSLAHDSSFLFLCVISSTSVNLRYEAGKAWHIWLGYIVRSKIFVHLKNERFSKFNYHL